MEKVCKWCKKIIEFKNTKSFGAHLTNCRMNPTKIKRDKNSKLSKERILICSCGVEFKIEVTDHKFNIGKYNKFCSRSCANKRTHNEKTRIKISEKLYKNSPKLYKKCKNCENNFETKRKKQIFCTRHCAVSYRMCNTDLSSIMGLKSCKSQNKRSKNEILFADMCISHFKHVKTNEPIFNGWDADIIIEDIKVAILWNGIWHYKKITEKHSVEQVQNRDNIKILEIIKCGYTPYIIKDMGKYDKNKIDDEWRIFNIWLSNRSIIVN